MRWLIVTGYFPPEAPLAATRVPSLATFLITRGHQVRIVAAHSAGHFPAIVPDLPPGTVYHERKFDLDALPRAAVRRWKKLRATIAKRSSRMRHGEPHGPSDHSEKVAGPWLGSARSRLYDALVKLPDAHAAWIPSAFSRGRRIVEEWKPHLIYASSPPASGLVAAALTSRATATPWFAELRDLWADNPYYDAPAWRRWIDRRAEDYILGTSTGVVTVTPGMVKRLVSRFGKPTALVMNGYDAAEYPTPGVGDIGAPHRLSILYTGEVYNGRRDPSPLFEALARLDVDAEGIRVTFVGEELGDITTLAKRYGVERNVEVRAPVTHREVAGLQQNADVLLMLTWKDPRERNAIAGKLFEYFGALRPILCIGLEDGDAAQLVLSREAGVVSNDPSTIAAQLLRWRESKAQHGHLAGPASAARIGLSRSEQFLSLETFVQGLIDEELPLRRSRPAPYT